MKASVIIPVFNGSGLTETCVRTILEFPPEATYEIIVVDDASTDDTQTVVERFAGSLRSIRNERNAGFAASCNRGARAAVGEHLVFLNNDTEPTSGWLDALVRHVEQHPAVSVVGSQLLFPNDTVQHAGVVFCQDGHPRHLYAGLPSSLPAVQRSRPFQAVTAASCLFRRDVFLEVGGFDEAFRNGMEDVDLCLRLGERGHGVHYCHDSVVYHLESASRGRTSPEIRRGIELYRERWAEKVRRDDLSYYVEDGFLTVVYANGSPLRIEVSPWLASLGLPGGAGALERSLAARSRQVVDLLHDLTALSAQVAGLRLPADDRLKAPRRGQDDSGARLDLLEISQKLADLEADLYRVQLQVAGDLPAQSGTDAPAAAVLPTPYLDWRHLVRRVREALRRCIPEGGTFAVVSRGEEDLVRIPGRKGGHFPRTRDGTYAGHHPADSDEALSQLEELREGGVEYLVFPATSLWWLDHYADFGRHLRECCHTVASDPELCLVFELTSGAGPRDEVRDRSAATGAAVGAGRSA